MTLVGVFWFEVPIHGHCPLLLVCTALFLMNTLGVGLLISTFSQTQQQAMMATFGWFFPAMLLSGFAISDRQHARTGAVADAHQPASAISW